MKKVLFMTVLLLSAVCAFAAVENTAHDLSSQNTAIWGVGGGSNTDESCVFCHTPHGAGASGTAPLWNRAAFGTAITVYGDPAGTRDAAAGVYTDTDAVLCLSCHDGTSLTGNLTNPPNALAGAQPTLAAGAVVDGNAIVGPDLSNDHPIGFSYDATLVSADGGLRASADVMGTPGMAGALSFGSGDKMWCSSCHDVHGVTGVSTFLRVSNAQSALCTACHIK